MSYQFAEKVSHKQQETAYILYMIIGSYFHKTACCSKCMEESLKLYYLDMKEEKQMALEEQVIRNAEQILGFYEDTLSLLNCRVSVIQNEGLYQLSFYTGFEKIEAVVDSKGRYRIKFIPAYKSKAA